MPRLTGPLLSLTARGQLGQAIVYADWRGIQYARSYVIPSNPNSVDQQEVRNIMRTLNQIYQYAPASVVATYTAFVASKPLTERNQFIKASLADLQGQANLDTIQMSQAFGGAPLSISGFSSTPGVGTITVAATIGALPTGWSLVAGHAAALFDDDPEAWAPVGTQARWAAGSDATSAFSIVLSSLASGNPYQVAFWLELLAPDGTTRYSAEQRTQTTPT
jgi:hypothetical protein